MWANNPRIVEIQTCRVTMAISVAVPQKDGINLPQGPAIALLSIHSQNDHPSFHRRHLLNHVHCCSIHNSQKLETIEMLINRKVDKNVVNVYNRILLNHFKSNITKSAGKWMKLEKK